MQTRLFLCNREIVMKEFPSCGRCVQISSVNIKHFAEWLDGQTLPFVESEENPTDWAYLGDFLRWANGLPITD